MRIRFLQTCPSENPAFPFLAGQVIRVTAPPVSLLALCDGVHAECVKDDDEIADPPCEQPEPMRRGRRRAS